MDRKARRETTQDEQEDKMTDNSGWTERQEERQLKWRERQEDRPFRIDRKAKRQTTQDGKKDKKTDNSGWRARRQTT
jgi:hypothetical protein